MFTHLFRKTDPLAERRASIEHAREVAHLDRSEAIMRLEQKRAGLQEEYGQRCLDYEMRFNKAYSDGLNLDQKRMKGPATLQSLLAQVRATRALVDRNPFAKSAITNIANYTLGRHGMRLSP